MNRTESLAFLDDLIKKVKNMTPYEFSLNSIIAEIRYDEKRRLEKIELFMYQTGMYK